MDFMPIQFKFPYSRSLCHQSGVIQQKVTKTKNSPDQLHFPPIFYSDRGLETRGSPAVRVHRTLLADIPACPRQQVCAEGDQSCLSMMLPRSLSRFFLFGDAFLNAVCLCRVVRQSTLRLVSDRSPLMASFLPSRHQASDNILHATSLGD